MALQFRRVVTGHDASGRAIVKIDEIAKNLVSSRPGATSCVVWTSQGFPVDNTGDEDAGLRKPVRPSITGPFSASSNSLRGRAREIIAPTRSIMPW